MITKEVIKNIHNRIYPPAYKNLRHLKYRLFWQNHFLKILNSGRYKFSDSLFVDLSYYCTYHNYKILC